MTARKAHPSGNRKEPGGRWIEDTIFVHREGVTVWIAPTGVEGIRRGLGPSVAKDEAKEEANALVRALLQNADKLRAFAVELREGRTEGTFPFSTARAGYYVNATPEDPDNPDFMQMFGFAPHMDYSLDVFWAAGEHTWFLGRVYFEEMAPPTLEDDVRQLWEGYGLTVERWKETELRDGRIRWVIVGRSLNDGNGPQD